MVRERVAGFGEQGNVPISLAQDLIKVSAYWIDNPQGITHPEPGMADNIVKGPHGWELKFGANSFLVEHAILLCKRTILEELDHAQEIEQSIDRRLLHGRLITCIRRSVAGWDHKPFDYYKGGASPELKRKQWYTADSIPPSPPRGLRRLGERYDRERYGSTPPSNDEWKDFMKFGAHAIRVEDVVKRILHLAGLQTVE